MVAPAAVGGLESVVRILATGCAQRGARVGVAAFVFSETTDDPPLIPALRAEGVDVRVHRLSPRDYLGERAAVASLCKELRPDVVHTHGYRCDVVDGHAARRLGIPTVTTVHGTTSVNWKDRLYERIQRRAFRHFDAVIAVSRPLYERLAAAGVPSSRLHLLANAYGSHGSTLSREEARARLSIPLERFVVGWVGRLSHEKGPDVFVRAFAALGEPDALASVLGDGADRDRLRALASEGRVAGRVQWQGNVLDAGQYFRAFDVFVLSSRTEGIPIALFEAMAAGVPIVATRVGGVPDVVSDGEAMLVPPNDHTAIAEAIRAIRANPAAAQSRTRAARERLRTTFALEAWLDRYEAIYSAVMRRAS